MKNTNIAYKILITILLSIIFSALLVYATTINTFSNGLSAENLTFTGNQNITRYINIPIGAKVNNVTLSVGLIGKYYYNYTFLDVPQKGSDLTEYFNRTRSLSTPDKNAPALVFIQNSTGLNVNLGNPARSDGIAYRDPIEIGDVIKLSLNTTYDISDNQIVMSLCENQLNNNSFILNESFGTGNNNCFPSHVTDWDQIFDSNCPLGGHQKYTVAVERNSSGYFYSVFRDYATGTTTCAEDITWTIKNESRWFAVVGQKAISDNGGDELGYIITQFEHYNNQSLRLYVGSDNQINVTTFTEKYNFSVDVAPINDISSGCTCTDCSIDGDYCNIPFVFHSDTAGTLEYSNLQVNYTETVSIINELTQQLITENINVYIEGIDELYTSTNTGNFTITDIPTGERLFTFEGENWTRRAYLKTSGQDSLTFNAYLLKDTYENALIIDYIFRDSSQDRISDAKITFKKEIDGVYKTIHSEYTDYAGQLRLSQDSNTEYRIIFEHPNYATRTFDLRPIKTEYNIQVVSNGTNSGDTVFDGIKYYYTPQVDVFNASGWQWINFSLYSSGDLEYFGLRLDNHSYTCDPASCEVTEYTSTGGTISININLDEVGSFQRELYFKRSGYSEQEINFNIASVVNLLRGVYNIWESVAEFREEIGPVYSAIIGSIMIVAAVGTAAELGIFGFGLILLAVLVNIGAGLLGFYSIWIALLMAIFGLAIYFMLGD